MAKSSGNDGNSQQIDIKITGDASGFEKAVKQVEKTSKELTKNLTSVDEQVQKLTDHFNNLLTGWNGSIKLQQKAELPNYIRSGDVKKSSKINGVERSYTTSRNSMIGLQEISKMNELEVNEIKKNGQSIRRLQNAQARLTKAMEKEAIARERNADKLAKAKETKSEASLLAAQNTKERTELNKGWLKYRSEHPERFTANSHRTGYKVGNILSTVGNSIEDVGLIGRGVGGVLSTVGAGLMTGPIGALSVALSKAISAVKDFSQATSEAFQEIESAKTNLSVVYGSSSQANLTFNQLADYATKSPFGVEETTELAVLLKQSGVYSTELLETLKMIGDTTGGNMEKMKRIANNYAQIVASGKATSMDMRQFANAGIPIYEQISKELGVSQQELRKLIADGKVTSEIVEKVFKDMTGINGVFENATEIGAKTLKARTQNLNDMKQLALASVGESINIAGERYGGDSLKMQWLKWKENFWDGLYKWRTVENIEKNVKTLSNNKTRIDELKTLIDYANKTNNKDAKKLFEDELKRLEGLFDIDKEREMYLSQYQNSIEKFNSLYAQYGGKLYEVYSGNVLMPLMENLSAAPIIRNLELKNKIDVEDSFKEQFPDANKDQIKAMTDAYFEQIQLTIRDLREYERARQLKLSADYKTYLAHYETDVLQSQESAYADINKASDSSNSALSVLGEIRQAWEKTSEQQEKAQQEQKSLWSQTIDIIQQIEKHTDKKGVVDIASIGMQSLLDYRDKGILRGEKLDVVNKNGSFEEDNRKLLTSQYITGINVIRSELANIGNYIQSNAINDIFKTFDTSIKDDKAFLANFDKNFSLIKDVLTTSLDTASTDNQKELYKKLLDFLQLTTLKLTTDTVPEGLNLDKLFDTAKLGDTFIPLWKRILSQATDVSVNAITGTKQTLDFYSDNLAVRTKTGNVLSTGLKNGMSVEQVQRLTAPRLAKTQLQGDDSDTWQIDWKRVNENISKFAKQLSTSTDIIDTYTTSLEAELDTYNNLIGSGILTSETDGVSKARYISAKQADKVLSSLGEQGVNAFGEKLVNETGDVVASIKDGIAYDKEGNKLANQNLVITGKIYEEIKTKVDEIKQELQSARTAQINNNYLKGISDDIYSTYLINELLKNASSNNAKFIYDNQDFMKSHFENTSLENLGLSAEKIKMLNEKQIFNTNDLFSGMLSNKELQVDNELVEAMKQLLLKAIEKATELLESEGYKNLKQAQDNKGKIESLNKDYSTIQGFNLPERKEFSLEGVKFNEILPTLMGGYGLESFGLSGENTLREIYDQYNGNDIFSSFEEFVKQFEKMSLKQTFEELFQSVEKLSKSFLKTSWTKPFEFVGESIVDICKGTKTWQDTLGDIQSSMTQLAGQMLQQIGPAMAEAGFALIKAGANTGNWGMIAAGLGMAALGGFAQGFGSFLSNTSQESDDEDEIDKLEDLKSQLADLLEQARSDALYYEKNLRHKKAIGTNSSFSYQTVNDAIIAPNGNIISTAPDDYLIATKTPQAFANTTQQTNIKINNIVNNNANVQVRQEEKQNSDGSVDIITYIEEGFSNFIASERSDEAFNIRSARLQGRSSVM